MKHPDAENHWVKPVAPHTAAQLNDLIAAKELELKALKLELFNLEQGPRLEAIAQIRNIMRAHELTREEIAGR